MIQSPLSFLDQKITPKASAGWSDQLTEINVDANLPSASFYDIVYNLMLFLLALFTIFAIISFVVYGMMFLFSGANKNLVESASKGVKYSIIGILIGLSGYIVINFINELLWGYSSWYF